jgi:ribonucleoside-triphosphate reductase
MLDQAGVKYEYIDAEEKAELSTKYGVKTAPTLVDVNGKKVDSIANVSNIKKYLEGQA